MEIRKIKTYGISQESYLPVQTEFEDKQYLVVPVVMMVEGVHSGSRGALLHLAEELGRVVDAWNGIPITLTHPQNENVFISANSPQTLTEYYIGRVFNTQMDGEKLKAEAWFDIQALAAKSPESLAKIQAGEVMEVSVGVFSEEQLEEGVYNGESYVAIAKNLRPDHLALLPGQVGACSVNDGCGLRVNKKGGKDVLEINHDLFKNVSKKNHTVISFSGNVTGLMETVDKVREALYTRDSSAEYYYLEDVFPGYVIYRKRVRQEVSEGIYSEVSNDLYKETYSIEGNVVTFANDPVKVARKIEYPIINTKKEVKMCEPCKEKVNALIAHTSTHFDESDRTWLEALTEDKLDKLIPKVVQVNASVPSLEDAWRVVNTNAKSIEDYTSKLPESIKAQVETGLNAYKEMRNGINQNIISNTEEGTWSVEELDVMSLETLQKLEKSVVKGTDYSVQGVTSYKSTDGKIAPMLPNAITE